MKKTVFTILIIITLLSTLFLITGCGNDNSEEKKIETIETFYNLGTTKIKVLVPKIQAEDGTDKPKYEFTTTKPENAEARGSVYLVTDKAIFAFSSSRLVYNTGIAYKEKYGEQPASFAGWVSFVKDPDSKMSLTIKNFEEIKLNNRDAAKYDYRYGTGSGELHGYNYRINIDELVPGSMLELVVTTKEGKTGDIKSVIEDEEVKTILNSITIEAVQ